MGIEFNTYISNSMKIDHLLQFDIPEGVKTITVGNKTYSKEEFNNLKNSKRKESLTNKSTSK